jgi:hypothetical protein
VTGASADDELARSSGSAYLAPIPDTDALLISQRAPVDNAYLLTDLYHLQADTGETQRLTYGLRAMEPDVSPDGTKVAFVRNSAGTRHLLIAERASIEETQRFLVRNRLFDQVYTPRFSPDGRWIAFSQWSRGGFRDIHVINIETGEVREITTDRALDTGPSWSPDGSRLYFSSDRSGIANIYAYGWHDGSLRQVTDVIGGAYQPSVSPNGEAMVYLGYGPTGFDLYRIDVDPSDWTAPTVLEPARDAAAAPETRWEGASRPYRPLQTLWPRAYALSWDNDSLGRAIGLSVVGNDAVGNHSLSASLSLSLEEGYPSGAISYSFLGSRVPLSLSAYRVVQARGGLQVGGVNRIWTEDAIGGSLSVRWGQLRRFRRIGLSGSYSLTYGSKAEPFGGRLDPNSPPPRLPYVGLRSRWRLSGSYSDTVATSQDISASEGRRLGLSLSYAEPHLGSPFREFDAQWSLTQYLEVPWREHHVLALRYGGGLSFANRRRYPYQLGGFPSPDLLSTLMTGASFGGVAMRGYVPGTLRGDRFHLVQIEYRLPLLQAYRGLGTFPFYVGRVHGTLFSDIGTAYPEHVGWSADRLRASMGAELHTRLSVGYHLGLTLRLGFAWGFSEDGGPQAYMNLGTGF